MAPVPRPPAAAPRDWDAVRPMLATPGPVPTEPDGGWAFEMKWDGVRALVHVDRSLRLLTRQGRDVTATYPELAEVAAVPGVRRAVLDGEVVALGERATPDFGLLQRRMGISDPAAAGRAAREVPVMLLVFDLLRLDGEDLMSRSYDERRAALDALGLRTAHVAVPPGAGADGAAARDASRRRGLEGVVAKRRASPYRPGVRSRDWVKVKNLLTQEAVIVGYQPGQGARAGTIGSLLLALPGRTGWQLVGSVGSGLSDAEIGRLGALLEDRTATRPPLSGPVPRGVERATRWVRPELVAEVAFTGWTRHHRLRQPVWRGLRPDKRPDEVVLES